MDDILQHHGVKGMKWGVRRYQNYDGTRIHTGPRKRSSNSKEQNDEPETKKGLTDKQKRAIAIGAAAIGLTLAAVGNTYVYKKGKLNRSHIKVYSYGKKKALNSFSKENFTVSKSTPLQRMSTKSAEDYVKDGESIFASYLKDDNALYKEQMPNFHKRWYNEGIVDSKDSYVHKLKLKKDLNIASDYEVAKSYMKANKIDEADEIDSGYFTSFMTNLVERDNPIVKEFVEDLKRKGFDGIVDANDSIPGFAKKPILIFDPKEVIESSKSHKLNQFERFINVITS